jgi:hypothetical protein
MLFGFSILWIFSIRNARRALIAAGLHAIVIGRYFYLLICLDPVLLRARRAHFFAQLLGLWPLIRCKEVLSSVLGSAVMRCLPITMDRRQLEPLYICHTLVRTQL